MNELKHPKVLFAEKEKNQLDDSSTPFHTQMPISGFCNLNVCYQDLLPGQLTQQQTWVFITCTSDQV